MKSEKTFSEKINKKKKKSEMQKIISKLELEHDTQSEWWPQWSFEINFFFSLEPFTSMN